MTTLLAAVFAASLLGSLHCVGMCGPIAALAGAKGGNPGEPLRWAWLPTAGYQLGRLATYALLGAAAGALGMLIDVGGSLAGWQRLATYLAGGMMIAAGGISLARQFGWRIRSTGAAGSISRALHRGFRGSISLAPVWRGVAIGALTSLMPCGWLHVFTITAAGTGDPVWGAVTMVVFWSGSVPLLVGVAWGAGALLRGGRLNASLAMAVLAIAIGGFTLVYRAPIALELQPAAARNLDDLTRSVLEIDHQSLPCCSPVTPPEK